MYNLIENKNNIKYITFLGPKGSFSNLAANKYSVSNKTDNINTISCVSFYDSIKYVENNLADYTILPIENNNSGSINDVYNILQNTSLFIIDEIIIPINHCILINKKTNIQKIEAVYSHPEPFKQCSKFIKLFPHWKIKCTKSTSLAMKIIKNINSSKVVALGSEEGGELYKLKVLKRNIANKKNNNTRFIILSRSPKQILDNVITKTTLILLTNIKETILKEIFFIFNKYYLNTVKFKYRFIYGGNSKNEIFYIDIISNSNCIQTKKILYDLNILNNSLKMLGCYPSNTNNFYIF